MQALSGIALLEDMAGEGGFAEKGDSVVFNMKLFLNHGDEIHLNALQAKDMPPDKIRIIGDEPVIDREITLGKRQAITAIEHALIGMQVGGYRRIKASPHLAYGEQGVPKLIPANAALVVDLWLQEIR